MAEPLLSVRQLCVDYITPAGPVRAVDRLDLDLFGGEIIGVAGESGCGKTTFAKALMRILPPPAVITGGEVHFRGQDILSLDDEQLRRVRWREMSMVFQSAMDALNPVVTVGEQIRDTLAVHGAAEGSAARRRVAELLEMVGIDPEHESSYAHQLSGGMRQRVGIALALALEPSLVILDEPTTALDVVVERQILGEIRELQRELGFAVLFITHDLSRMLQFSDRVAVLYAARLAELGPAAQLREGARHPYTQGLMRAFPTIEAGEATVAGIGGTPPSLIDPPTGCRFHPRCPEAEELCRRRRPAPREVGPGHHVDCRLVD